LFGVRFTGRKRPAGGFSSLVRVGEMLRAPLRNGAKRWAVTAGLGWHLGGDGDARFGDHLGGGAGFLNQLDGAGHVAGWHFPRLFALRSPPQDGFCNDVDCFLGDV
jgi:hypothetical protein